jgi:hypothetical protein
MSAPADLVAAAATHAVNHTVTAPAWRERPAARVLLAAAMGAALLGLLLWQGQALVTALLPALRRVFEWLVPEFAVVGFGFDRDGGDQVLRAVVRVARYAVIGQRLITPEGGGQAQASTLVLQGLQGGFVALWIALAWPARDALRTRVLRLVLVLPLALLLICVDAPVVLAASLWQFAVDAYDPGGFWPLLTARDLLQGGGRLALGALLGGAAVTLVARVARVQRH